MCHQLAAVSLGSFVGGGLAADIDEDAARQALLAHRVFKPSVKIESLSNAEKLAIISFFVMVMIGITEALRNRPRSNDPLSVGESEIGQSAEKANQLVASDNSLRRMRAVATPTERQRSLLAKRKPTILAKANHAMPRLWRNQRTIGLTAFTAIVTFAFADKAKNGPITRWLSGYKSSDSRGMLDWMFPFDNPSGILMADRCIDHDDVTSSVTSE